MLKGLIFDFDGLIVDTESPIYQSWQELYQSYGGSLLLEDWIKLIGSAELFFDPWEELERQVGHAVDREAIEAKRQARELTLIEGLSPLPGVQELLQEAKESGLQVALASSSPCSWVTGHLEHLGLAHYFDFMIASDDVKQTKPDPELFLVALSRLGIKSNEAIVFEDSLNGVLAAKRAGIFVVAVPNALTNHLPLEMADLRVNSLSQLSLDSLREQLVNRDQSQPG